MRLILASASPQRRTILKRLRVPFRVIPSRASERSTLRDPRRLVVALALRKASQVARERCGPGADTIVFCRGGSSSSRSRAESERILRLLNNSWHRVYTVSLVLSGRRLAFRSALSAASGPERGRRSSSCPWRQLDKAGAAAGPPRPFIKRVSVTTTTWWAC